MKILVIAGEASADIHAAHLIHNLKKKCSLEVIGIGGENLEREGLRSLFPIHEMAVVGLTEALKKIPQTLSLFKKIIFEIKKEKPDLILLLDLPDFNLRLAKRIKDALDIPIVYYISPQVWAWRSNRVFQMDKILDLLMVILPFEKDWYQEKKLQSLKIEYVGHPVISEIPDLPYSPLPNKIAILPGSRESEWDRLLEPLLQSAIELRKIEPRFHFVIPLAENLYNSNFVSNLISKDGPHSTIWKQLADSIEVVKKPAHEVLRDSKLAWVASGTATLEAAIVGIPMVVVYKVSPMTAFLFKRFINYQGAISMVNLIHCGLGSKEKLVPELLQDQVTPANVIRESNKLLQLDQWALLQERLAKTRDILSGPMDPVENAAITLLNFMKDRGSSA
ncbi:MAG: lipid-A-disaccharide synthase [Oligoflexia bacterium]|nr:lipid-A-disaccharide synthase [Oligoflexia bacterium]